MPRHFDENDFVRLPAEKLRGVGCPVCGRGVRAWYSWRTRSLNLSCASNDCMKNHLDGVPAPPWAQVGANTTLDTWSGKLEVEVTPRELTLKEIDGRRGVKKAVVRPDGWTTCPFCRVKFATASPDSWKNGRHVSCKTRLELVTDTAAPTPR